MAIVFLDTSALVRRYDPAEPGVERVRALCRRPAGHVLLVNQLATVEVASAFNRKLREGHFDVPRRDRYWRLFRHHLRVQYRLALQDGDILGRAQRLLFRHPLRAYDAIQIASALTSRRFLAGVTVDFLFCTADRTQAQAAASEELTVELIA